MQRNATRQVSTWESVHFLLCSSNQCVPDISVSLSFKAVLHGGGKVGGYQNHPGKPFQTPPALLLPQSLLPLRFYLRCVSELEQSHPFTYK